MKSFHILPLFLFGLLSAPLAPQAQQGLATASFPVSGVCGMCKIRIEDALDVKGVNSAAWDRKTQTLTVVYRPAKISEQILHQRVAAVGHDTPQAKAPDAVYQALPACCKYRDGAQMHED